jgi:hypothetical protein
VAQQGSPPGRVRRRSGDDQHGHGEAGRVRRPGRSAASDRPDWQRDAFGQADTDTDVPSWAGPSVHPARPVAARRRPDPHPGGHADEAQPDHDGDRTANGAVPEQAAGSLLTRRQSRAAATRLRKSRRRVYRWCGVAIVVCVIGAVTAVLATSSSPKPQLYVTSLQPGEFKSVPSACSSVSTALLNQYLPGSGRTTTNQFSGATQSECSFTVDARPVFRLLEVTAEAYQPFAAASGDGSASANAKDNLALVRQTLTDPGKKSPLSPAQITQLTGLGQRAFAASQRETVGDIVSTVVTVVVLDRNVLITVELSAQQSSGFTSTPAGTLQAGATAAAKDVLAKVLTQPTA